MYEVSLYSSNGNYTPYFIITRDELSSLDVYREVIYRGGKYNILNIEYPKTSRTEDLPTLVLIEVTPDLE